jgi:hypothetical protein
MTHATLTFVKETGQYHHVWIRPEGEEAIGVRLHVRHDLPHLAVESVLGVDDGLWACLVSTGEYPGLTDAHRVAKGLVNSISGAAWGPASRVAEVRERLAAFHRPERVSRQSFDKEAVDRVQCRLIEWVERLDDDTVSTAALTAMALFEQWDATPVGEAMKLDWPLTFSPESRQSGVPTDL